MTTATAFGAHQGAEDAVLEAVIDSVVGYVIDRDDLERAWRGGG